MLARRSLLPAVRCRAHQLQSVCASSSTTDPLIRPISRLLIANRGEIALRVMRTARKMGVETVAVYSEADKRALHARTADKAYHIGPAQAAQSYLNQERIIETALKAGAHAIHPGYGFLSENAEFAERCSKAGLVFVGPPVRAIRDMGTKSLAKQIMSDAGVPVVQGYHGEEQSDATLHKKAQEIGYPVMLKAVYGGGGKGMRIARSNDDFFEQLASARSEAKKSFGNDLMLVEKFVERPRHVEVQVFGDHHGNFVYLWERDCSVQRRHQKIIEEAPAPLISDETRRNIGESAVRAAAAVDYRGAGTVEFILDPRGEFYFMEMNTRLQVEHPVSEAITGVDLVEWQLRVARGEPIPLRQADIRLNGHAMECRVYAEDTKAGFMPTAGRLDYLRFPSFARVDTGVVEGDEVSVHYDPMIAKVIVWGQDRKEAASRLDAALRATKVAGLSTNIDFVRRVLAHKEFQKGNVYTDFIPDFESELFAEKPASQATIVEGAVAQFLLDLQVNVTPRDPFLSESNFRLNYQHERTLKLGGQTVVVRYEREPNVLTVQLGDQSVDVRLWNVKRDGDEVSFEVESGGDRWSASAVRLASSVAVFGADEREWTVPARGEAVAKTDDAVDGAGSGAGAANAARAPMPGIVDRVLVKVGEQVVKNQAAVVVVAMKMEYIVRAPADAVVEAVTCSAGQNVPKGTVLVKFADPAKAK